MNTTLTINANLIRFGIPLGLLAIAFVLMRSPLLNGHPGLSFALTVDLVLTIPLVYFLLIRTSKIPKTTVLPVMILGVLIGSYVLPEENQMYLDLFKTWALPVIELSALTFIIFKVRKAVRQFKSNSTESLDFFTTLKTTCSEMLPKAAVMPVVMEISVIYYGFITWKRRDLKENEFSYHKDSGTPALLIAFIFLIAIETLVLHILLYRWSEVAAWILTCLSIYSGIQILGFLKSMLKRPISIEGDKLCLRYGIMSETTIDLDNIASIDISSRDIELNDITRKLSILGELESHNLILSLKKENELLGLYGAKKTYKKLTIYVDNPTAFKDSIDKLL